MKKMLLALALVAACLTGFVACGSKGTCELCGTKNVSLKTLKIEGENAKLCSDCYDLSKGLLDLSKAMGL